MHVRNDTRLPASPQVVHTYRRLHTSTRTDYITITTQLYQNVRIPPITFLSHHHHRTDQRQNVAYMKPIEDITEHHHPPQDRYNYTTSDDQFKQLEVTEEKEERKHKI